MKLHPPQRSVCLSIDDTQQETQATLVRLHAAKSHRTEERTPDAALGSARGCALAHRRRPRGVRECVSHHHPVSSPSSPAQQKPLSQALSILLKQTRLSENQRTSSTQTSAGRRRGVRACAGRESRRRRKFPSREKFERRTRRNKNAAVRTLISSSSVERSMPPGLSSKPSAANPAPWLSPALQFRGL